ncbi:hypothetical protein BBD42_13005 [Paenibacillus sp. BIHB 4019]|uniref:DUF7352 domain-containing protein n=1 Tax=Paenibacillus sp. BIHB 4019 TaxID=1870819 RepID=A0A1B2DHY0_9BACL|nr:hypothetical protein [Paenibacillus sp. BIHB 4019]ANY67289.1 hypothetical protein BBD42_13005 [Paenibacillus sp. BIHB 4019]
MAKILKYKIKPELDVQTLSVPVGAKFVSVIEQRGEIVVYAMVDGDVERKDRHIYCVGTGWDFDMSNLHVVNFIGTAQVQGFVAHVIEVSGLYSFRI